MIIIIISRFLQPVSMFWKRMEKTNPEEECQYIVCHVINNQNYGN